MTRNPFGKQTFKCDQYRFKCGGRGVDDIEVTGAIERAIGQGDRVTDLDVGQQFGFGIDRDDPHGSSCT